MVSSEAHGTQLVLKSSTTLISKYFWNFWLQIFWRMEFFLQIYSWKVNKKETQLGFSVTKKPVLVVNEMKVISSIRPAGSRRSPRLVPHGRHRADVLREHSPLKFGPFPAAADLNTNSSAITYTVLIPFQETTHSFNLNFGISVSYLTFWTDGLLIWCDGFLLELPKFFRSNLSLDDSTLCTTNISKS